MKEAPVDHAMTSALSAQDRPPGEPSEGSGYSIAPFRVERITGPWDGLFIAAYTAELEGRFYGYAKLCETLPVDVWTADALMKIAAGPSSVNTEALQAAENRALQIISALRAPVTKGLWSSLFGC